MENSNWPAIYWRIGEKIIKAIYMSKENITNDLLKAWEKELSKITKDTNIKFEIRALEDFIK